MNGDSRILDHRTPTERVERVAPWLRLDGNVYPAVVEGRVQWIVDGFTTSANYPNSRLIELAEATSDSVAQRSNVVTVGAGQVNYVRNAVKATVDAYTGEVKLYGWDTKDPMLKAWSNAFPGSVRPLSEISGDLMAHIRYPQDFLKVQRELLTEYHVTNPGDFFSGSDKWRVPRDPSSASPGPAAVLPVDRDAGGGRGGVLDHLAVRPGEQQRGRPRDPAWPAGRRRRRRQPGRQAGGRLRPAAAARVRLRHTGRAGAGAQPDQELPGTLPERVRAAVAGAVHHPELQRSGKTLTFGNLLSFPLEGRMFYVQPIYVQAASGSGSFPQNKAVVTVYGNTVAWGDTLGRP